MTESLFQQFVSDQRYSSWGGGSGMGEKHYRCNMIEQAIRRDDVAQIKEAIISGWLTAECRAFDNSHVIDYCLMRGARACALELRALGWPEWQRAA